MTTETRTRVRKPDAETETETVITEEGAVAVETPAVEAVEPTPLQGPFTRDGFHIVDNTGRRIAMCGAEGDVVRTGPGIAEAFLALLNRA